MEIIVAVVFMGSILVMNNFYLKTTKEINAEVSRKLDTLEVLVDAYNFGLLEIKEVKKNIEKVRNM